MEHREKLPPNSGGKFALFESKKFLGLFNHYTEALRVGYESFGISKPFFIQHVGAETRCEAFVCSPEDQAISPRREFESEVESISAN